MKNQVIEKRKDKFEENCRILDFDTKRGVDALVLVRESFADYVLEKRAVVDNAKSEKGKEIFHKQYEKVLQAYKEFSSYVSMMCEIYEENEDDRD